MCFESFSCWHLPGRLTNKKFSVLFLHCLTIEVPRSVLEWIFVALSAIAFIGTLGKLFAGQVFTLQAGKKQDQWNQSQYLYTRQHLGTSFLSFTPTRIAVHCRGFWCFCLPPGEHHLKVTWLFRQCQEEPISVQREKRCLVTTLLHLWRVWCREGLGSESGHNFSTDRLEEVY